MSSREPLLAAEGPPRAPLAPSGDPFRALDDLMAAIEILCKRWPPREAAARPWRCLI